MRKNLKKTNFYSKKGYFFAVFPKLEKYDKKNAKSQKIPRK